MSDWREELAKLRPADDNKRFFVVSMGYTGSTWLAKLLNSHRDIFCSHEDILRMVYPAKSYQREDQLRFIAALAASGMHGAYKAIGDVGSIWLGTAAALPKEHFTRGILIRHPARVLRSTLAVAESQPSNTNWQVVREETTRARRIQELFGLRLSDFEGLDRMALWFAAGWVLQVRALDRVGVVIKIEEMRKQRYAREKLLALTGVKYDRALIARANRRREDVQASQPGVQSIKEILNGFSLAQQRIYDQVVREVAEQVGYEH